MERMLKRNWAQAVRVSLRVALVLAVLYVAADFYSRWTRSPLRRDEPATIQRVDDFYVHPPKSYVTNINSAQKLVGQPLWVISGYRFRTQPAGRLLEPLERIVPAAIVRNGGEAVLRFEHNGRTDGIAIGPPDRLYIDEMFYIKDPRQLYDHWPQETWTKVENHEIELGMTEFQVTFALGAGETKRSSQFGESRVVEYRLCEAAGLQPVRVTFHQGRAEEIEQLPTSDRKKEE
jgi:hypothetical protein